MTITEILGVFTYAMASDFLESLSVLLVPVLLSFLLPRKWFSDAFIARGTALVILLLGYAMYFSFRLQNEAGYPKDFLIFSIFVFFASVLIASLLGKVPLACKILETFSDRALVFLFLSIPVSVISLVVVIWRNLF